MKLIVPLFSQGELIGTLNLGPRLSELGYSRDDRKLLADLAAYCQPAREFGGDFYDFIELPDGQIGVIVGDVTDKGVPAALVMATTHSILRTDAPRLVAPGDVLARANELLTVEIPPNMFVTCGARPGQRAVAVRERQSRLAIPADAGRRGRAEGDWHAVGAHARDALRGARGRHRPGDGLLLHSDGLVEAHNEQREMFGFPRLKELVGQRPGGEALIDLLLAELGRFTGGGWEQEDDIALVTLQRTGAHETAVLQHADNRILAGFSLPSEPGNEEQAIAEVIRALQPLGFPQARPSGSRPRSGRR